MATRQYEVKVQVVLSVVTKVTIEEDWFYPEFQNDKTLEAEATQIAKGSIQDRFDNTDLKVEAVKVSTIKEIDCDG